MQRRKEKIKKFTSGGALFALTAGLSLTTVLPATAAEEDTWENALEVLETIDIRDGDTVDTDYSRSEWGGWLVNPDTGCTTQQDILIRDTIPETQVLDEEDACVLIFGESEDPYSGDHVVHDRDDVEFNRTPFDIDHVVSLSDAYHSGGHAWEGEQKREFSQDQENLVASLASINRQKSDSNLNEWLPPSQDRYYEYVSTVVYVKDKYDLSMTQAEYDVAESILNDEGYEDTLASPAITMTLNYREAQEEPTDEPTSTDAPTVEETPTTEPTTPEDTTDDVTDEPSIVPSRTASITSLPAESFPAVVPEQPSRDTGDRNTPTIIEEDVDETPTFDLDDGESDSTGDQSVTVEPRNNVLTEDDGEVSGDGTTSDGLSGDGNTSDGQESIGDLTESDQEIERLADAGASDWITWAAGGSLAAIALGAFFVFRAQTASRKH